MDEGVAWWRRAVVYQIYPRSFADSNGDGIGDLEGIRRHLEHLEWLGIDAVWLSPIYRSPMADFGYDVSDHCDVDPVFGDLATFDRLLADCHAREIHLLLDWVPNHTSDAHPWFRSSRSSRDDPLRSWYLWRDGDGSRGGAPGTEPNNWRATFGGPAWTWDEATRQWYLHLFLPAQPDLNWAEPAVEDAMHGVLRFWLDRGVDGFRADVVHLIGKDEELPDHPDELSHLSIVGVHDHPRTHGLLQRIRKLLDRYDGDRVMVGEVNLRNVALLAPYYGDGDELHLVFNFSLIDAPWEAPRWADLLLDAEAALGPRDAWPVWVVGNHDNARVRTRLGGSERRARVAGLVLLTLRGTPFVYAGDELGLLDAELTDDQRVDPGGRDGCRAPLPWDAGPGHGWPTAPWLPFAPAASERSVAVQREEPGSVLHLYRRLLAERRRSNALRDGSWALLESPQDVLAYERAAGDDVRRIAANFGAGESGVSWREPWRVVVATDVAREGAVFDGRLAGDSAVIVEPA
jgi:alpha-glucosidase